MRHEENADSPWMSFELGGLSCIGIKSWYEERFIHGFCDRFVDVKSPPLPESGLTFPFFFLNQIHGTDLVDTSLRTTDLQQLPSGDGWEIELTAEHSPGLYVIKTADCSPVMVFDCVERISYLIHCGWRGAVKGLLTKALARAVEFGSRTENLQVAIGPTVGQCCYEIGEDVAAELIRALPEGASNIEAIRHSDGKTFGNISGLLGSQAVGFGVPAERVFCANLCTICNKNYFSYRREKDSSGRQLSFILAPTPD